MAASAAELDAYLGTPQRATDSELDSFLGAPTLTSDHELDAFLDSPTAPTAPDTLTAAPALTPTSGTLPTTNVAPALAGPPPGILPTAVSPETPPREFSDAEVFGPPLSSPVALTDPRLSDTPLFPAGSQVGNKNQATPLGGFWNTFAPTAAAELVCT